MIRVPEVTHISERLWRWHSSFQGAGGQESLPFGSEAHSGRVASTWTVHPSLGKLKRRQNKNHGAWALLPKDLIFIIQAWNMGLLVCFSDVQVALKCQFSLRTTSRRVEWKKATSRNWREARRGHLCPITCRMSRGGPVCGTPEAGHSPIPIPPSCARSHPDPAFQTKQEQDLITVTRARTASHTLTPSDLISFSERLVGV